MHDVVAEVGGEWLAGIRDAYLVQFKEALATERVKPTAPGVTLLLELCDERRGIADTALEESLRAACASYVHKYSEMWAAGGATVDAVDVLAFAERVLMRSSDPADRECALQIATGLIVSFEHELAAGRVPLTAEGLATLFRPAVTAGSPASR